MTADLIIYSYGYNPYKIMGASGYAATTILDDHLHMENRGGNKLETHGGSKLISGINLYNTIQITFSRTTTGTTAFGFRIANYSHTYNYPVNQPTIYGAVGYTDTKNYSMVTMTAPLNSQNEQDGYFTYGTTNGNSKVQIIDIYEIKLLNI